MAATVLSEDVRPVGAGDITCTALWDLDTCQMPDNTFKSAEFVVNALASCLGATMIFVSSGSGLRQQQMDILAQIPKLHIAPAPAPSGKGSHDSSSFTNLQRVSRISLPL